MPTTETKTLGTVIRSGWKQLALADQSDADVLLELVKQTLQDLEEIEAGE